MKKITTLLIIIILILGLLSAKNLILKAVLENMIKALSGLGLSVEAVDIGFIRPYINMKGVVLLNPEGFYERIMFEIQALYIEYDVASLFSVNRAGAQFHIRDMVFHLKLLNVIKDKEGRLNLNYLNAIRPREKGEWGAKRSKVAMPSISIDRLHLKVGKVIYKDYTQGPSPKVSEFDIDLDERYEDIRNPYALGSLIVSRALFRTNVSRLAGFDLKFLEGDLKGIVVRGAEKIKETAKGAVELSSQFTREAAGAIKETQDILKKTIKFPFKEEDREVPSE